MHYLLSYDDIETLRHIKLPFAFRRTAKEGKYIEGAKRKK